MRYLFLILYFLGVAEAQCPETYTGQGSKCYRVTASQPDWAAARRACQADAADLASITDSGEAAAVTGACLNAWTGLNDLAAEGQWTWISGASNAYILSAEGQQLWSSGQPDNYLGQDCVAVTTDGNLDDFACTLSRPACCQFVPSPSPTASPTPSKSVTPSRTPSRSITPSNSKTTSPSPSPGYDLLADQEADFSSAQNTNGWTWNYYYGSSETRTLYTAAEFSGGQFRFQGGSWCRVGSGFMHPNSGGTCSTPSYGLCKPSVLWTNPEVTSRPQYKITFSGTNPRACGSGVAITLKVNGAEAFTDSNAAGGPLNSNRIIITEESLQTVELISDPVTDCNCDGVTFALKVYGHPVPTSPTPTPTISDSPSVSASPSTSTSASATGTISPSQTPSLSTTPSQTATPTASLGTQAPLQDFICSGTQTLYNGANYRTNAAGITYVDNFNCITYFNSPPGRALKLTVTGASTEPCCDFFTVYDGLSTSGTQLLRISGTTIPPPVYSSGQALTVVFNTDYSIIDTGVQAKIEFVDVSPSPTPSRTPSRTGTTTRSASVTGSVTSSPTISATATVSSSSSASLSPSESSSPSATETVTTTVTPSVTASASQTVTTTMTSSPSASPSESASSSPSASTSTSVSASTTPDKSWSVTATITSSPSVSPSVSTSPSLTSSTSQSPSISVSASVTPTSTVTRTVTRSARVSPSVTRSTTASVTITTTRSPTTSVTPTVTWTPGRSRTPTATRTPTRSVTATSSSTKSTTASVSITRSASLTPSTTQSVSQSVSVTQSASLTPTITKSVSPSESVTQSASLTMTPSQSISQSVSPTTTASATASTTMSPSPSPSQSPSQSISSSISITPSRSSAKTVSPTSGLSTSPTASITASSSPSASPSVSASESASATATISVTPSQSISKSLSITATLSVTPSQSVSSTASISASASQSPSTTATLTVSVTISPSATPSPPSLNDIPLSGFTEDTVNALLGNLGPQLPPLDRLAAGFFATNPGATSATFSTGNLTLTLSRIDPAAPLSLAAGEGGAELPPLPGVPADAVVYLAAQPFNAAIASAYNLTGTSTSIGVSSADGAEVQIHGLTEPLKVTFPAPAVNASLLECSFYNVSEAAWSTDGCTTILVAGAPACSCNHMTEFGLRFRAIAATNEGIFASLGKLGTAEGLAAALPIILLLASLGAGLIVVLCLLQCADRVGYKRYAAALDSSAEMELLRLKIIDQGPNDSWDRIMVQRRTAQLRPGLQVPRNATIPQGWRGLFKLWIVRLPYQHPWLGIFLRFDPAMPRIYRGILITCSILTTVAISILFYGYKNGAVGDGALPTTTLAETLVLSLITTAVAAPISTLLNVMSRASGRYEFMARYPYLCAEMTKISRFLKVAKTLNRHDLMEELADFERRMMAQRATTDAIYDDMTLDVSPPDSANAVASTMADSLGTSIGYTALFQVLFTCLCSRQARASLRASCCPQRVNRFRRGMLQFIKKYSHVHSFRTGAGKLCGPAWLPIHTPTSTLLTILLFIWMGGCCTYILGFTSYQSAEVTFSVFTAVAVSQATSNLIIQPLLQFADLFIPFWRERHNGPEEAIYYPLEVYIYKVYSEFVAQACLAPCASGFRSVIVTPPATLMKKIELSISPEAQRTEARLANLFWALD